MDHEMRTLTPEVAEFYATSLGDVFTPDGDAGVIDALDGDGVEVTMGVKVVGCHDDGWYFVHELTYNHTDYLRVKAMREREGY